MNSSSWQTVLKMLESDAFSAWLGMDVSEVGLGSCVATMKTRNEMANGFGIVHGGVVYSFADSVFGFAANSYGKLALSIDTSMSQFKAVNLGDVLVARAVELKRTRKLAWYEVAIKNQMSENVAIFKGQVYIRG